MAIDALESSRRSSGQQIGENRLPAAAEGGKKDGVGVGGSNASVPTFEFKEYSDSASHDENNDTAEAKESAETKLPEDEEESGDDDWHRTASDQEHEMDVAQQKKNRRTRAQPGAKRGGRRDTERGGWFQLLGRKKTQFEPGDLVEAEWAGTGWWYVGYIRSASEERGEESAGGTPGAPQAKTSKRSKELFHVVFEDGDEADVIRRDLKRLQPTVHLFVGSLSHLCFPADVGLKGQEGRGESGRNRNNNLGRNAKKHSSIGKQRDTEEDAASSSLVRKGSLGDVDNRLRQGEKALWGRRGSPSVGSPADASGNGGDSPRWDWWETGTPYAFQPRLAAAKATVMAFVEDDGDDGRTPSRTNSTASGLMLPHQQQRRPLQGGGGRSHLGASRGSSGELLRIVKAPETNESHGQRVFFLA
ncbi:unnamed protein product [Ectocarpus sp. CCAP 1310/34]|nr:unnamed protein product [Ectocarpus sp. CCAP 1310/34]